MASLQANDPRTWELTNAPFFQASLQPSPFFAQFLGQLDQDGNGSGPHTLPADRVAAAAGCVLFAGGVTWDPWIGRFAQIPPTVPVRVPWAMAGRRAVRVTVGERGPEEARLLRGGMLAEDAGIAYSMCMQYTLRNLPLGLDRAIRERAKREHKSLNEVAIEALLRAFGLQGDPPPQRDLSGIVGSWQEDPEFDRALDEQRRVDPELWR